MEIKKAYAVLQVAGVRRTSGAEPTELQSAPPLLAPVLFRLALHRRRRRVLELEPVRRSSRTVVSAEPLRHNAFEAKLAGVGGPDLRLLWLEFCLAGAAGAAPLPEKFKKIENAPPPLGEPAPRGG